MSSSSTSTPSRRTALRVVVPVLAVLGLASGVHLAREATQSRHQVTSPDSRLRVVIEARSKRSEPSQHPEEVVRAHLAFCQLEVGSNFAGDLTPLSEKPRRYSVVMAPALDSTDRKQFRGCVEDWIVDNHRIDVISMEEYHTP